MSRRFSEVVTSVTAVLSSRGKGWCPTICITGLDGGKPFVVVVDLFETTYLTENAAIAAGEQAARERVRAMQPDRASPPPSALS